MPVHAPASTCIHIQLSIALLILTCAALHACPALAATSTGTLEAVLLDNVPPELATRPARSRRSSLVAMAAAGAAGVSSASASATAHKGYARHSSPVDPEAEQGVLLFRGPRCRVAIHTAGFKFSLSTASGRCVAACPHACIHG